MQVRRYRIYRSRYGEIRRYDGKHDTVNDRRRNGYNRYGGHRCLNGCTQADDNNHDDPNQQSRKYGGREARLSSATHHACAQTRCCNTRHQRRPQLLDRRHVDGR